MVVNDDVLRGLRVTPQQLREIAEREARELARREHAYRGDRPPLDVTGKTVILVDDGLATGSSMMAAVRRSTSPIRPRSSSRFRRRRSPPAGEFAGIVDDVVCASMPTPFLAVGNRSGTSPR